MVQSRVYHHNVGCPKRVPVNHIFAVNNHRLRPHVADARLSFKVMKAALLQVSRRKIKALPINAQPRSGGQRFRDIVLAADLWICEREGAGVAGRGVLVELIAVEKNREASIIGIRYGRIMRRDADMNHSRQDQTQGMFGRTSSVEAIRTRKTGESRNLPRILACALGGVRAAHSAQSLAVGSRLAPASRKCSAFCSVPEPHMESRTNRPERNLFLSEGRVGESHESLDQNPCDF